MPKIPLHKFIANPLILDNSIELIYFPKAITLVSRIPVFDFQKEFLGNIYNKLIENKRSKLRNRINIPENMIENFESLVNISNPHSSEDIYTLNQQMMTLINSNSLIIEETKIWEFYISMMFSLMNCMDDDKEISYIGFDKKEFIRFRIHNSVGLTVPDFSFKLLYRKLSTFNIVKVIKYMLLEGQIIFFAENPSDIVAVTEALLSLISPLYQIFSYS